ncbi:alpha/beta hydrolase [Bdellovibrionota bacterium]
MTDQEIKGEFQASGGIKLASRAWQIPSPRARLLITHGFGEHCGRYKQLAKDLNAQGISVHAWDLRGHGKSPGIRGHVDSFNDYYADLHEFRHFVAELQPSVPIFLFGHSLGGLITFRYVQDFLPAGVRGVILSSPFIGIAIDLPKIKLLASKILKLVVPRLTLYNELNATLLSHDPSIAEAYDSDPLVHHRASSAWFYNFLAEAKKTTEQASEWNLPIAVLYAGSDQIVSVDATEKVCSAIDSELLTQKRYEDFYHEIFNEVKRDQPLADLISWMDQRLK